MNDQFPEADSDTLYQLTPLEFEQLGGQILENAGLQKVIHVGGPQDYGVDFTAEDDGQPVAVEVRHTRRPLALEDLQRISANLKASPYKPRRLIIITSARISGSVKSELAKSDLPVRVIDGDEVLHLLNLHPNLRRNQVVPAEKRSQRQHRELIIGAIGLAAGIIGGLVSVISVWIDPGKPSLHQRIETVESAIDNLKSLEKELIAIKQDMAATEQATKAIEQEYEKAKVLQKLTDEQVGAIKSALERQSWRKTLIDYFLGFVLGVGGSLTASVIYTRWQQQRALNKK